MFESYEHCLDGNANYFAAEKICCLVNLMKDKLVNKSVEDFMLVTISVG